MVRWLWNGNENFKNTRQGLPLQRFLRAGQVLDHRGPCKFLMTKKPTCRIVRPHFTEFGIKLKPTPKPYQVAKHHHWSQELTLPPMRITMARPQAPSKPTRILSKVRQVSSARTQTRNVSLQQKTLPWYEGQHPLKVTKNPGAYGLAVGWAAREANHEQASVAGGAKSRKAISAERKRTAAAERKNRMAEEKIARVAQDKANRQVKRKETMEMMNKRGGDR